MVAALAAPPASMAAERLSDVDILNFGLRFERLQATFYTEADSMGTIARMSPPKQRWARVLGAHERAHVRIIKKILGDKADRRPFFDFHGVTETDARLHAHCRRHGGAHGRPARRDSRRTYAIAGSQRPCSVCSPRRRATPHGHATSSARHPRHTRSMSRDRSMASQRSSPTPISSSPRRAWRGAGGAHASRGETGPAHRSGDRHPRRGTGLDAGRTATAGRLPRRGLGRGRAPAGSPRLHSRATRAPGIDAVPVAMGHRPSVGGRAPGARPAVPGRRLGAAENSRGNREHRPRPRASRRPEGPSLGPGGNGDASQRPRRLGSPIRVGRLRNGGHAPRRRSDPPDPHAAEARPRRLPCPGRDRHAPLADPTGSLLHPQPADALRRPDVRATGVRHERSLDASLGLARRRLHRHPRNLTGRGSSPAGVARLIRCATRTSSPRQAHAGRHAADHQVIPGDRGRRRAPVMARVQAGRGGPSVARRTMTGGSTIRSGARSGSTIDSSTVSTAICARRRRSWRTVVSW